MSVVDPALREYYAARASEYDTVYAMPERQDDLRAMEAWLPPWFAGRRVLEVACGTGYWTRFIASTAACVHGIDAAPETLAIARARVPDARVTLAVGDAWHPPRADPPWDAAFAGFWLSHVPRRLTRAFVATLAGVLAPGAPVVFIDNRYVEGSSTPVSAPDAQGDTWQERRLADGSTHRVLKNFPDDDELRAMVEGTGHSARVHHWPHYWALTWEVA